MTIISSWLTRLYALAILAFPASHRAVFRTEMLDTFRQALRHHQGWAGVRFGVAASVNAVGAGVGERRRQRQSRASSGRGVSLAGLGSDLLLGTRALMQAKAFTFVSVVSLGVGMGLVMAIVILLRILTGAPPGIETTRVVEVLIAPQGDLRARAGDWAIETWFYPDFMELRRAETGMTVAGWATGSTQVDLPTGGSRRARAMWATENYFNTLGLSLAEGRGFDDRETQPVVVVSHRLWQTMLNSRADVVGSTLLINGVAHTVVGLAPEGFVRHLAGEQMPSNLLYLPLQQHPLAAGSEGDRFSRERDWVRVLGRLNDDVDIAHAGAAVESLMAGLAAEHPDTNADRRAMVAPYAAMGASNSADIVVARTIMLGASGLVLLIVCLNVSGMVLVRSARREREIAVRLALGASRLRLMQYLLAESLVLALLGGALAASVLYGIASGAAWWFDTPLMDPRMRPDVLNVLVSIGLCFVTSLFFGLIPAIRFSRPTMVGALKDESAGGGGRRVGRTHRIAATFQAAIAIPFLVIAVIKLDQVRTTATADLGFSTEGLYALPINQGDTVPPLATIRASLERAPGVSSVTLADGMPLDFIGRYVRTGADAGVPPRWIHVTRIDTRFMETMDIPLLMGRPIVGQDRSGGELVTVLTEPLARSLFPDGDVLGRQLTLTWDGGAHGTYTVVGVTADMVASQMASPRQQLFVALAQHPPDRVLVIARASAPLESVEASLVQILPDFDRALLNSSLVTGEALVRRSMNDLATQSAVAAACGGVALILTALGVFGVVGFLVAARTREIGVRIALGASRTRVLGMVLGDTVRLVVPGVAVGLGLGLLAVRSNSFELAIYDLGIVEPLTYVAAAGITIGVALLSGLSPARRAARVEPIIAMRSE